MSFTLAMLNDAIGGSAAIRRRRRLQPAGGVGDKIFPPTYPGEGRNAAPQHVFEQRRIDGSTQWCALLDSVQAEANRLEEAVLEGAREGVYPLPRIEVDFRESGLGEVGEVSSLDAPHRVFDAIFRDSSLDGQPFMLSPVGRRLQTATMADASAILEVSPTALLFGAWNSTGEGGGLGAKFPRVIVSEIIAVNVPVEAFVVNERTGETAVRSAGRRTGSRIDPLGILRSVELYAGAAGWDVDKTAAGKGAKKVRPSEINHGNIAPSVSALGVTMDYAEHVAVLSLAGLRRLRFGEKNRDVAGRSLLAALGLLALLELDRRGYALRSRCDLVPEGAAPFEIVHADGTTQALAIGRAEIVVLYRQAYDAALAAQFVLNERPLRLAPQPKLVDIVRRSREKALQGDGEQEETADVSA